MLTRASTIGVLFVLAVTMSPSVFAQDFSRAAPVVAGKLAAANKKTVAVVDFTDLQMNVTELGRYLAEEFQGALFNEAKGFKVIDRTHLKAVLQENKLASTGIIDPAAARQLGKIAGVDSLVTGSITVLGDSVRLSLKVLDAATAEVVSMTSIDVPKTQAIDTLSGQTIPGTGASSTVNRPSARTANIASAVQRKAVKGVAVELLGCTETLTGVRCDLTFTNQDRDKGVGIGAIKAFDTRGSEYTTTQGQLGSTETTEGSFSRRLVEAHLITGVTTPGFVVFERIPSGTRSLSALYLDLFVRSPDTGISVGSDRVDFRNIAVSPKP